MRRRISQTQVELGIRVEEATEGLSQEQVEFLNRSLAEVRGRRSEVGGHVPPRPSCIPRPVSLTALARTGYHFCKGCQRIVQLVSDPEIHLTDVCEFNPAHSVANGLVQWHPPV